MRLVFIFLLIICTISCASAEINHFKESKAIDNNLKSTIKELDKKYVGFTKEAFVNAFGKPHKVVKDSYPYSLNGECIVADCSEGFADELLTYEFLSRDSQGKYYYSIYAYIKDGKVVRIR